MRTFIELWLGREYCDSWWIMVLLSMFVYLIYLERMQRKTSSCYRYHRKMISCKKLVFLAISMMAVALSMIVSSPFFWDVCDTYLKMTGMIAVNVLFVAAVYIVSWRVLRIIFLFVDLMLLHDTALDYKSR